MILDHSESHGLRLLEAEDLKRFKLRLAGAERRPDLKGVSFVDDDNALIDVSLPPNLPGAPSSADWRARYQAMIDYATSKGWIDTSTGAIRAHVERIA